MRGAPLALAAAVTLVRFADEWAAFLPAGSLEPMRAHVGLSYAEAGAVLAALPAGGLLGNVFIVAADHVSRRLIASLGALGYGLAMLAFGAAHSFEALFVAAFLWGAASDAFVHGAEVALVDLAGADLPLALARMHGWAAAGDFLGPATIAAVSFAGLDWRWSFYLVGGGVIGYAAWLASQRLPAPKRGEHRAHPLAAILDVLKDRRVLLLGLVLGLFGLLDEPLLGFLIAYLERARGLSGALAMIVVGAILAGQIGGYAAFEKLAGPTPGRRVAIGAALAIAAALPMAVFLPSLPLQALAGLAFGAAGSIFYTTLDAAVLGRRPGQTGAVTAVVGTIGMADLGFPAVAGLLADAHGLAAALALYAAVPALVLALLIAGRSAVD